MPGMMPYYFPIAIVLAFAVTFILGWFVEWGLIRFLYKRPLGHVVGNVGSFDDFSGDFPSMLWCP